VKQYFVFLFFLVAQFTSVAANYVIFTVQYYVTNRRLPLFSHIARSSPRKVMTTTEAWQRVSDKYCRTGSDQQEDLATLGSVQLRQTLAL